jgi:soluble lytic murein transglycosylase-like protein
MFTFLKTDRPFLASSAVRNLSHGVIVIALAVPIVIFNARIMGRDHKPASAPSAMAALDTVETPLLEKALEDMRYGLSASDLWQYKRIFAATDREDWQLVDRSIPQIQDRRLIGHVLAARYLSPDAQPTFADLRSWMDLYRDQPEADDIYQLAQLEQPKASLPQPPAGQALNMQERDPDAIASSEPKTAPGDRAVTRFYTADDKGALEDAAHAIGMLGQRASTSLWIGGLAAWKLGHFTEAAHYFGALAKSHTASGWMLAAGAYWAGRVEEHNGVAIAAKKWFDEASRYPTTFYGMLATRKLGIDIAQEISSASLKPDHLNTLAQTMAGYRAVALLQIGRRELAARELERIDPRGNPKMEEALVVVSDAAHLGEISPALGQRIAQPADDANTHFPIPSWRPRGGFHVDPALVYAVIRQESRFDPKAISPAGATGLMQIMPGTANAIAGQAGRDALFDPSTNLDVGQRYLKILMKDPNIGENLLMLAVAYNGGSGNPAKLRHILEHEDPLIGIESIQTTETREFIQHVLVNYWIYRARLGGNTDSLTDLADGRWPVYKWSESETADTASLSSLR